MHVDILTKLWDHKQGDWDTHTHRGTQISMKLSIGNGADMGSQVDINSCSDACTHSKQGVGPQAGRLGHTHSDTQGHPSFYETMHRG